MWDMTFLHLSQSQAPRCTSYVVSAIITQNDKCANTVVGEACNGAGFYTPPGRAWLGEGGCVEYQRGQIQTPRPLDMCEAGSVVEVRDARDFRLAKSILSDSASPSGTCA